MKTHFAKHPIGACSAADRLYNFTTGGYSNSWRDRCLKDALNIQLEIYLNYCAAVGRQPYTEEDAA